MQRLLKTLIPAGLVVFATMVLPGSAAAQRSGVDIWSQNCGRCHRPQPPNRYTADQWETIMAQMRIIARLTDADAAAILQFLQGAAKQVAREEASAPESTAIAQRGAAPPVETAVTQPEVRAAVPLSMQNAVERYIRWFASPGRP